MDYIKNFFGQEKPIREVRTRVVPPISARRTRQQVPSPQIDMPQQFDIPSLESIEYKEGYKNCYAYESEAYYDFIHDGRSMYTEFLITDLSDINPKNVMKALLCMRFHNLCHELIVSILRSSTRNIIIRCCDKRTKEFVLRGNTDKRVPEQGVLYEQKNPDGSTLSKRMGKLENIRVVNIPNSFIFACIAKDIAEKNINKECTNEIMDHIGPGSNAY